jgi:hypothetical protein
MRSGQGLEGDGLVMARPHVVGRGRVSLNACLQGNAAQSRLRILARFILQPCGSSTPFLDALLNVAHALSDT